MCLDKVSRFSNYVYQLVTTYNCLFHTFTRSSKNPSGHHRKHGVTKHHHCGGRQQTPSGCGNYRRAGTHCCLVQRGSSKNVTACIQLPECVLHSYSDVNLGSQQYGPSAQLPLPFS